MQKRSRMSAGLVAVLMGALLIFGSAPASAQEQRDRCPAGQPPGRPPGRPAEPPATPPGQPADRPPQYPPGRCQLALSKTFAERTGIVAATGDGFVPGETVTLSIGGRKLAELTAGSDGAFSTTFTVPADAALGATQVRAASATQVLSANFEVVGSAAAAAPAGTGSGSLPRTGTELAGLGGAGILLIGVGTAAVMMARRRKAATV